VQASTPSRDIGLGTITLRYTCPPSVDLTAVAQEFESGATFALYLDREIVITGRSRPPANVSLLPLSDGFEVTASDIFLPRSVRFTRLATSFLANLLDFGLIRLESIDIRRSNVIRPSGSLGGRASVPPAAFGTVVKPYFKLSATERASMICGLADLGFDLVKEDECYIVPASEAIDMVDRTEAVTSRGFLYIPNVTGFVSDHAAMGELVDRGTRVAMVNALITGLQAISDLTTRFPALSVWVHRVGYAAIAQLVTRRAFTQLATLAGASMIHVGTPVTKADFDEVSEFAPHAFGTAETFRPVFTKLTPEVLSGVEAAFGPHGVYMVCGWVRDASTGEFDDERLTDWLGLADSLRARYR
jgi:hypothetical protein